MRKAKPGRASKALSLGGTGIWLTPRGMQTNSEGISVPVSQTMGPVDPAECDVPESFTNIDYWKAMEWFETFDVYGKGEMDKRAFHRMVSTICRGKELMSKAKTGLMFDKIDLDNSGIVEKEEFLSWIFSTFSNYCGNVRRRLSQLDPAKLLSYYRMVDRDGSGTIDCDEFFGFISKFGADSEFTRESSDQLFNFIDGDKSGGIDIQEFLDWVHPQRALERKAKQAMERAERRKKRALARGKEVPEGVLRDLAESFTGKENAVFEMPPNSPLILEFTTGPQFLLVLNEVERLLRNSFDEDVLQINVKFDRSIQGCRKLVALVGSGVLLWDRFRMMPFMEDPFTSVTSTRRWVNNVLMECLPDLVKASGAKKRSHTKSSAVNSHDIPLGSKASSLSLPGSKGKPALAASASAPELPRAQPAGSLLQRIRRGQAPAVVRSVYDDARNDGGDWSKRKSNMARKATQSK